VIALFAALLCDASPYDVRLGRDLAVAGAAGGAWVGLVLAQDAWVDPSCAPGTCQREDVPAFDRVAIDQRHKAFNVPYNLLLATMVAVPAGIAVAESGWARAALDDTLVIGQAFLLSGATTSAVKLAVQRPRPFLYRDDQGAWIYRESEAYLSFWSGHTAAAFSAATATALTFHLRHPRSRWRFAVWAAALALATAQGVQRGHGGDHFPSDVVAGAACGTTFGLAVPLLHRRTPVALVPTGAGLALVYTPASW
jgi:membrane-associated phospholipid phosphatase